MTQRGLWLIGLLVAAAVWQGCGGEPVVVPDQAAFDQAVQRYLDRKTMQLTIAEYKSFQLDEQAGTATAVIAMKYAGEGYSNVTARFQFNFVKAGETWRVASHDQL